MTSSFFSFFSQKIFLRNAVMKQGRSGSFILVVVGIETEGSNYSLTNTHKVISEDLTFIYR